MGWFQDMGIKGWKDLFIDPVNKRPMTQKELLKYRHRMAERPPSFTELLPYITYEEDDELFVLKDGLSLGMLFELGSVATEAQTSQYLEEVAHKVKEALKAIPESDESDDSPWIVQFFVNDDLDITSLNQDFKDYIAAQHEKYPDRQANILNSPLTQAVIKEMEDHLRLISKPDGLFVDTQVTGQPWHGQRRRIRCCLFRRFKPSEEQTVNANKELKSVANTLMATLSEAGVAVRRGNGKDLYDWLMPFFNRKPMYGNSYPGEFLKINPYPGDKSPTHDKNGRKVAPIFGWELRNFLNFSCPKSNMELGCFEFDGVPVKAMTLQALKAAPGVGHLTAELPSGKEMFARFDRLPPGSMLSMSIVVAPQHKVQRRIERIRDASRANTPEARETFAECEAVLENMVRGDKLFPMMLTVYLTAPTGNELQEVVAKMNAQLEPSGLQFIDPKYDLVPLDGFLRALPFNFDPVFDHKYLRRTRLTFASQIAALMPVYGRAKGTPHPGMMFWNRGGEPVWMDPLNKKDRKKNAHMLVLGPTGAGKSATLNYIARLTMAVHKPRLVIVDAGRSFELLVEDFKTAGLSTHKVSLTSNSDVSLPPFLHAYRLLDDPDVMSSFTTAEQQAKFNAGLPDPESIQKLIGDNLLDTAGGSGNGSGEEDDQAEEDETSKRDLLGEMLIAAVMMITGGEPLEVAKMGRADRYLVSSAIIKASMRCKHEGQPHPLTQDVAFELMNPKDGSADRQARAVEMGQAMMTFAQGLRGRLFNRFGSDWPDADVTLVEMGTLTQDGYADALTVAYTSLLDSVQSRAERFQDQDRPLIMLTDEGHLITTNELLGPKIAKGTKMWRKLNCWFWLATQNLADFPDSMSRVLSMCEYWMLLTMDKDEIEQVARFRRLTTEQRSMMESARKEPPKYTEGVMMSALGQVLFRNVPPALPIALAMTEGHEKAQRRRIMDARGCTELQAAYVVAEELTAKRA